MDVKKLGSGGDDEERSSNALKRLVCIAGEHFKDFYITVGDGHRYWIETNSAIWAESTCKRYIIEQEVRLKRHIAERINQEEDE